MTGEMHEIPIGEKLMKRLARLASIELSPQERKSLRADLQEILSYVERLGELSLDGIDASGSRMQAGSVTGPDVPRPGLGRQAALGNAPDIHGGFFKAPPIIER